MRKKTKVIYGVALLCIGTLLTGNHCSASNITVMPTTEWGTDYGTISPLTGGVVTPATASLSISTSDMASTARPNEVAIASTSVTVDVKNASSYSLTLSFDDIILTNGKTTINAGNPGDVNSNNVWGYKWDTNANYAAPSASGNTLIPVTALPTGNINFIKTLAFAVKFADGAEAGSYKTSGMLSLVASPKGATYTLADLQEMQQLTLAPDACKNTTIPNGQNYAGPYTLKDVRDNNTYTVYKFKDDKCWMTQNLRLGNQNAGTNMAGYPSGRILNPTTTDITADEYRLPAPSVSGFSDDTASNMYLGNDSAGNSTGYYTWCAATAGTCASAPNANDIAPSSICPKGWRLPTGGRNYTNGSTSEFYNLIMNGILKDNSNISSWKNSVSSNNYFSDSNAVNTIKGSPYNFAFTGNVNSGTYDAPASNPDGYWWSSTASSSTLAYLLNIYGNNSTVYPGTSYSLRRNGFAVRCVAQ